MRKEDNILKKDYYLDKIDECDDCKEYMCYEHSKMVRDIRNVLDDISEKVKEESDSEYIDYYSMTKSDIIDEIAEEIGIEEDQLRKENYYSRTSGIKADGWKILYAVFLNEVEGV